MRITRSPDTYLPYVRVTRILSVIARPGLVRWAARLIATHAVANIHALVGLATANPVLAVSYLLALPDQVRDGAAGRGSEVHALIHQILAGEDPIIPDHLAGYLRAFDGFLNAFCPLAVLGTEVTILHEELGYAGTIDALLVDERFTTWLVDFKTGAAIYPEYGLQVLAYARATHLVGDDGALSPMPRVDKGLIVHLRPDGTFGSHAIDVHDEAGWEVFKAALVIHNWLEAHGRRDPTGTTPTIPEEERDA